MKRRFDWGPFRAPSAPRRRRWNLSRWESDGLALQRSLVAAFAVMGDAWPGDALQHATAAQMVRWHELRFLPVLMLGDNMYAAGTPEDYAARFRTPGTDAARGRRRVSTPRTAITIR